jgi:hypothetical protein
MRKYGGTEGKIGRSGKKRSQPTDGKSFQPAPTGLGDCKPINNKGLLNA